MTDNRCPQSLAREAAERADKLSALIRLYTAACEQIVKDAHGDFEPVIRGGDMLREESYDLYAEATSVHRALGEAASD